MSLMKELKTKTDELLECKEVAEELKQDQLRDEGVLAQLKKDLKEAGFDTVEEAEAEIEARKQKVLDYIKEAGDLREKFLEDFKDFLE